MQLSSDPLFRAWVLKTIRGLGFIGTRMDIGLERKLVPATAENGVDACQGGLAKKDFPENRLESMTYADWVLFDHADSEKHAVH